MSEFTVTITATTQTGSIVSTQDVCVKIEAGSPVEAKQILQSSLQELIHLYVKRTLQVKKYLDGYGITDGKLWFWWYYITEQQASKILTELTDPEVQRINVTYDHPYFGPVRDKI